MVAAKTQLALLALAAAVALAAGGAEAVCRDAATQLPQHTALLHATTVASFDTDFVPGTPRTQLHRSGDINHPFSPAWFAAGNNPAFSVHVGTRYFMGKAPDFAGSLYLYSYRTTAQWDITDCDTHTDAFNHVRGLDGVLLGDLTGAGASQKQTGYQFCNHHEGAHARRGYTNRQDAVRHEQEYILCNAHNEHGVEWTGRTICTVRATETAGDGNDKPTLWVNCGEYVNGGRWYQWDLNGNNFITNFKDAGAAAPGGMFFRELLSSRTRTEKNLKKAGTAQATLAPKPQSKIHKKKLVHLFEKKSVVLPKTKQPTAQPRKPSRSEKELFGHAAEVLEKAWPLKGYAGPASDPRK